MAHPGTAHETARVLAAPRGWENDGRDGFQQIKGLHGRKAKAWPYDSKGRYIQGPPTA